MKEEKQFHKVTEHKLIKVRKNAEKLLRSFN